MACYINAKRLDKPVLRLHAEWFQEEADMYRPFIIIFYTENNTIQVMHRYNRQVFLKRCIAPLTADDFFIGSKITLYGRCFKILDFVDTPTRIALAKFTKNTFFLVKPTLMRRLGSIITTLIESKITITKIRLVTFNAYTFKAFLGENSTLGRNNTQRLSKEILSDSCIGMELIADNAIELIKKCQAKSKDKDIPKPLLELFDDKEVRHGIFCSQSEEDARRELDFVFAIDSMLEPTCVYNNSTLCIIRPHAIKEGNLGKIITHIMDNGFKITALRLLYIDRQNCEEFYSVYRGIVPNYMTMVVQLSSGCCVALEIVCENPEKNSQQEFRKFCGPKEPFLARILCPNSIRAKFGHDRTKNAIHCTDLANDAELELLYIFETL